MVVLEVEVEVEETKMKVEVVVVEVKVAEVEVEEVVVEEEAMVVVGVVQKVEGVGRLGSLSEMGHLWSQRCWWADPSWEMRSHRD